jgi:hypothetical protein
MTLINGLCWALFSCNGSDDIPTGLTNRNLFGYTLMYREIPIVWPYAKTENKHKAYKFQQNYTETIDQLKKRTQINNLIKRLPPEAGSSSGPFHSLV